MGSEWQEFSERFGRILKVAGIVLLLLAPLVFLAYSASRWSFLDERKEANFTRTAPSINNPKTFKERSEAPGSALLPSDETSARAAVPSAEASRIIFRGQEFLLRWENFLPPLLSGKAPKYSDLLRPFVVSDGAADIFSRNDVSTIQGLCPESNCFLGSELVGRPELKIIDYSGSEAYLVGSGLIRVISEQSEDIRFNKQSYALLMARGPSDWFVARAVAETS